MNFSDFNGCTALFLLRLQLSSELPIAIKVESVAVLRTLVPRYNGDLTRLAEAE